jgi:hypothetical protein
MPKLIRAALPFLVLPALAGCHARWFPLASAPGFSISHESVDGTFNKKLDATLSDDDNHYVAGFRFEIPAAGSIIASAKPVNPQAQVSVSVHAEGSGSEPIAKGEPGKKVEATELQAGTYYVLVQEPWKDAVKTRVETKVIFKPADPDGAQTTCKTQATARDLPGAPDKGQVEDGVDYSAMRRTCYWRLPLSAEGGISVKFDPQGSNISAEFIPPSGAPEKIDPVGGLIKPDVPAGDYFIKVFANDAGDFGRYRLATSFKMGDTCKNEPHCSPETAEDLKSPQDNKSADVDVSKGKQFHFYKESVKEKGKLTISFKILQPPRGSKVAAYFMKAPDDEGEKISGSSVTKEIDNPGDYFIRVQAPEQGDYGKFALSVIFQPNNFIPGDVVERSKECVFTVGPNAGTNQGVRAGLGCTVVNPAGQPIDSCRVTEVYPNLSKVVPSNPARCPPANSKVQISVQ